VSVVDRPMAGAYLAGAGVLTPLAACFKGVRALCRQSLTAKIAIADRR
jgi:hypothetical protein